MSTEIILPAVAFARYSAQRVSVSLQADSSMVAPKVRGLVAAILQRAHCGDPLVHINADAHQTALARLGQGLSSAVTVLLDALRPSEALR